MYKFESGKFKNSESAC